jgi:hypothetical protein
LVIGTAALPPPSGPRVYTQQSRQGKAARLGVAQAPRGCSRVDRVGAGCGIAKGGENDNDIRVPLEPAARLRPINALGAKHVRKPKVSKQLFQHAEE